jgi:hypothetical protein
MGIIQSIFRSCRPKPLPQRISKPSITPRNHTLKISHPYPLLPRPPPLSHQSPSSTPSASPNSRVSPLHSDTLTHPSPEYHNLPFGYIELDHGREQVEKGKLKKIMRVEGDWEVIRSFEWQGVNSPLAIPGTSRGERAGLGVSDGVI